MSRPINENSKRQRKLRELAELENRRRKEAEAQRLRDEMETLKREREALIAEREAQEAEMRRLEAERYNYDPNKREPIEPEQVEPEPIEPDEIEPLPSNIDEGKEISLEDLLGQDTEEKHGAPEEILSPDDAPDGVEFEEESEEEKAYREELINEEQEKKPGASRPPKMTDSADGENIKVTPDSGQSADWIIAMVDGFAQKTLPKWLENEEFTPRERRELKLILQRSVTSGRREVVLTDEDLLLLDRHSEIEEYKKTVPLEDAEVETLKKPLERLMREKGIDVPPGMALLIAVMAIYGPRMFTPGLKTFNNYREKQTMPADETES